MHLNWKVALHQAIYNQHIIIPLFFANFVFYHCFKNTFLLCHLSIFYLIYYYYYFFYIDVPNGAELEIKDNYISQELGPNSAVLELFQSKNSFLCLEWLDWEINFQVVCLFLIFVYYFIWLKYICISKIYSYSIISSAVFTTILEREVVKTSQSYFVIEFFNIWSPSIFHFIKNTHFFSTTQ